MKRLAALAVLLSAAAAPALAADPPRQCFLLRQMGNSVVVDDSTINARVGSDVWRIKMVGACPGLKNSRGGYILDMHGGTNICGPIDLDISVNDPSTPGHCMVETLRKLTAAETAALPKAEKP